MAEPAAGSSERAITGIEDACQALAGHRLAWIGQRASDYLPLAHLARAERLISCEGGADAELLAGACGARLVALEQVEARRSPWSNASVDALAALPWPAPDAASPDDSAPLNLLAYCATPRWEERVQRAGGQLRLLSAPAALKQRLDDKTRFRAAVARLGLPSIPSAVVEGDALRFADLARRFGEPLIVQQPIGASGVGTFEIHSQEELDAVAASGAPEQRWLVSRYMGPTSLNVHACAWPGQIVVAAPSVQLVGIAPLTHGPTIYCGNDFGAARKQPPAVLAAAADQTRGIGEWLVSLGFAGIFGVDFVVAGEVPYPLELNPRFQGSTGLLGQIEWLTGQLPLGAIHCLRWLGYTLDLPRTEAREGGLAALSAAQALFHWLGDAPATLRLTLAPGIYAVEAQGGLRLRRAGLGIAACQSGEFALCGLPPVPEAVIEPGATILRVLTREQLAHADGRSLTPWGLEVAEHLTSAIAGAVVEQRSGGSSG